MTTLSAHDVARDLRRRLPGVGTAKLQKLLYYCQGWHLAWFGTPLFTERIEAWDKGPVVADHWHDEDKGRPRPPARTIDEAGLSTIGYVVSRYGALSGADLIRLTHTEAPWRDASNDPYGGMNPEISHDQLIRFFREDNELADLDLVRAHAFADTAVAGVLLEGQRRSSAEAPIADDPSVVRHMLEEHRA